MKKNTKNYNEDTTWQTVYMDLITLIMVLFLILWTTQNGGKGVPIDTNRIIPFSKLSLKDSSFPNNGKVIGIDEKRKLKNYLTKTKLEDFKKLGHSKEEDSYYYISVHGHGSLTGNYEQNMNVAMARANSVAEVVKESYKTVGHKNFKNRDPLKKDRYMISVCAHSYNFPKVDMDTSLDKKTLNEQQKVNRRVDVMYHKVPSKLMKRLYTGD